MPKLSKDELLEILKQCAESDDVEAAHGEADQALINYIDDDEIRTAYDFTKWYA